MNPQTPLVLYHARCPDGFVSAWAANRYFNTIGVSADFQPMGYGEKIPVSASGRETVYLLDYCLPEVGLRELSGIARDVIVLDHHKSALPVLQAVKSDPAITNICYDFWPDHSGAWITWKHFFPNEKLPKIVQYVEDRDLWSWKLTHTQAVNAALSSLPWNFGAIEHAAIQLEVPELFDIVVRQGEAVLAFQERLIEDHIEQAFETELYGHRVRAVNCSAKAITSDLTGRLAADRAFGVSWLIRSTGVAEVSLRSRGSTGIDVSEVAKKYGGGGHAQASGFQVAAGWPLPFHTG